MKQFFLFLLCFPLFFLCGSEKEPYIILAIDGGGIRGIIPATVLTLLEEELGCKCAQVFDCMGGTSTGGILAVGLTTPDPANPNLPEHSAEEMLDIYLTKYNEIFYRPFFHKLTSMWGYLAPKYSHEGLRKLLKEELQNKTINSSVCDIVIPAYDLTTHSGFYFEYFRKSHYDEQNFSSLDVVLATTAAPTYFPSVPVADLYRSHFTHNLIDGGIIANNPAEFILIECLKHVPMENRDIYILSIGTGIKPEDSISYYESKDWGLFEYLNPLIDNLFDASTSLVEETLKALTKLKMLNSFRVNISIPEEASVMDNTEEDNIALLHELGKKCYHQNFIQSKKGQEFLKLLKNRIKNSKSLTITA